MTFDIERPVVSILLACFNQEGFIAEALDGALAQTYSPLEIVIVDDCSTDRTADIIAAKLRVHPSQSDIRFIRNLENVGGWYSGLITRGDFIVHSAGDDIMLPEMVEEMVKVWMEQDVSLVTTNAYFIDDCSRSLNRTHRDPAVPADDSFETLARDGSNACCFGPTIGCEREIYEVFGLPPKHLEAHDIMFPFYAYLLKGARFITKPLLKYRVHSHNTSLSLIAERGERLARLRTNERIFKLHLAHAAFMKEELERLAIQNPARYRETMMRILPLLTIQTVEMAKKLVRTRIELHELGAAD